MDFTEALARRVGPWMERADRLVRSRIEDSRSHAWHALTDRVVTAQDGRRTIQAAKGTRSLAAAWSRLAELLDGLDELIRDSRANFYRSSFDLWDGNIPDGIRDKRARPTTDGERAARTLLIHGRELRPDLAADIDAARRSLLAAVALAGVRNATEKQSREVLDSWAERTTRALQNRVRGMLSDSDVAIFWAVGRSLIREEFRGDE